WLPQKEPCVFRHNKVLQEAGIDPSARSDQKLPISWIKRSHRYERQLRALRSICIFEERRLGVPIWNLIHPWQTHTEPGRPLCGGDNGPVLGENLQVIQLLFARERLRKIHVRTRIPIRGTQSKRHAA